MLSRYLSLFLIGNLCYLFSNIILTPYETLVTTLILLLFCCCRRYSCAAFIIGVINCAIVTNSYLDWQVNSSQIKHDFFIRGQIVSSVIATPDKQTFKFVTDEIDGYPITATLKLSFYSSFNQGEYTEKPHHQMALTQGDKLSMTVRLKPVFGLRNQASFNYKAWLISEHIQATGYIKKIIQHQVVTQWADTHHRQIYSRIQSLPYSGVLMAIATGNRSFIEHDDWQVFRFTGTAHLMAISGLHIGLVFSWCWFVFLALFRLVLWFKGQEFHHRINIYHISSLLAWGVALFYTGYSGWQLPTVRAIMMLSVFIFFYLFKLNTSWLHKLLIAAVCIVLFDPFSLLSLGFWLSFSAVVAIMLALKLGKRFWSVNGYRRHSPQPFLTLKNAVAKLVFIQVFLSVILLPIQIFSFGFVSPVNFIANLLAIPFMSVTVIPLVLLALACSFVSDDASAVIFELSAWFQTGLMHYLTALVELSGTTLFATPLILSWSLFLVLMLSLFLPIAYKMRGGIVGLIIILILTPLTPANAWRVTVFDVGQGLAVLIDRNGKGILYDTGAAYKSGFNMYQAAIEPYLTLHGIELTHVVISHYDNDHAGGVSMIKAQFPSVKLIDTHNGLCRKGAHYSWLNLDWRVYAPEISFQEQNQSYTGRHIITDKNNNSCVLLVSSQQFSVLLTGDIEKKAEAFLVKDWIAYQDKKTEAGRFTQPQILLATVPHHGSNTSSTQTFLDTIKPDYWIISRGLYNRFNHPHKAVMSRLTSTSSEVLDTARTGQQVFYIHDARYVRTTYIQKIFSPWWS